jgi:hypothetical protein
VQDRVRLGADGLALRPEWECLPYAAAIGIVPALAMLFTLRRGAPMFARSTLVLADLSVAALANLGLQLFHVRDASIMVPVWHLGSVAVLAVPALVAGRQVLGWHRPLS